MERTVDKSCERRLIYAIHDQDKQAVGPYLVQVRRPVRELEFDLRSDTRMADK